MYSESNVFKIMKGNITTNTNDKRKLLRGLNCLSEEKDTIKEIAEELNIKSVDINRKKLLCSEIKYRLIKNEVESLDNCKWFYFFDEYI